MHALRGLSLNSNAFQLLENKTNKLDTQSAWCNLASNLNCVQIIEVNLDKLDDQGWFIFAGNPNAVHILKLDSKLGVA